MPHIVLTRISIDDGLILVAWLLAVGEAACVYNYTLLSWQGYHYYDIPELSIALQVRAKQFDLANQLLYQPILDIVKSSIIIFLWRLDDQRRGIRVALTTLFVFNNCHMVAIFFADLSQCTPLHYFWDSPWMDTVVDGQVVKEGGTCIDRLLFYLLASGFSVLTDILILLIPAAMVWNLHLPPRKKVAVWAIFSLGWIVTIVGVTRIVLYYYRFQPDNIDRSYSVSFTISGMEANVAIAAACGPSLKALFTHYVPHFFASRNGSGPHGHVHYTPEGYATSEQRRRSAYTGRARAWDSKGSRPLDAQYGMQNLDSIERGEDNESQEAIMRCESVITTKTEFDFGFENDPVTRMLRPANRPNM